MDNEVPKTDELKLTPEGKSIFPGRGFCLSMLLLFYIFLFYGSLTPFIFKPVYIGWNEGISQILATGGYVESQMDWYVNLFLGVPAGFYAWRFEFGQKKCLGVFRRHSGYYSVFSDGFYC